ncbi:MULTISPECIES: helix-turn-helix domain-containing protein [Bhargavaea]|uniref:Helix-turn-helix domain-containing protein n=1 Tax=Bhargavaea changchunensis TaxID=2134037 RepID=A0ABW2NGS6_9BACL|nr:helix-turn-helix transcriptional regulator [Bhargavaea sp. CC-171006]
METLGERIRRLRKTRKMTLQELAGDKMSKGMLSLIENNKAKPSMESLSHIASQLKIPASDLLEESSREELRKLLDQAEEYASVRLLDDGAKEARQRLINLIRPYIGRMGEGYESGRLLEMYGRSLHNLEEDGWEEPIDRAAAIYDSLNIVPRRAAIGMFRAQLLFTRHQYAEALETLLRERAALEEKGLFIEPMTRLDFDYLQAALLYAVGKTEEAVSVMERALAFSRENDLYYHMSDWYRLASVHALMAGMEDEYGHYRKKIRQYAEFADDQETAGFLTFLDVHELNSFRNDYEEAYRRIQEWPDDPEQAMPNPLNSPYKSLEIGKALSGLGRHEEALDTLDLALVPREYIHHPIDLSIFMEGEAYKAESLWAAGKTEEALSLIQDVFERISPLPRTPYKDRVEQVRKRLTAH